MNQMNRGSTLIEIIVAVGIIGLVMITLVSLVAVSVRNTALSKERAVATKYAQEGMEFFRREKEFLGWETFLADVPKGVSCLPSIPTPPSAFTSLVPGTCTTQYVDAKNIYQRSTTVSVVPVGLGSQVNVTITITWTDGNLKEISNLYETFQQTD